MLVVVVSDDLWSTLCWYAPNGEVFPCNCNISVDQRLLVVHKASDKLAHGYLDFELFCVIKCRSKARDFLFSFTNKNLKLMMQFVDF